MVFSFPFILPPCSYPSTDDTPPSIHEQLSTLIAISAANVHRLDAIITQMTTINTLISIQTGTMAKLIPPPPPLPPPNQQPTSPQQSSSLVPPPSPPPQLPTIPSLPSLPPPAKPPQPIHLKTLPPVTSTQTFSLPPSFKQSPPLLQTQWLPPSWTTPSHRQPLLPPPKKSTLKDLEDKVHLKGGGIDTCLSWFTRPPPWPDPLDHQLITFHVLRRKTWSQFEVSIKKASASVGSNPFYVTA